MTRMGSGNYHKEAVLHQMMSTAGEESYFSPTYMNQQILYKYYKCLQYNGLLF